MNRNISSAANPSRTVVLTIAAIVIAACACAQDQGGSLADAARQVRAQKTQASNTTQAQAIADELSEAQNDTGAPGGFKTFNAGDYQLWVPAPYHMDGHDDAGVVLSGPQVGVRHPIVLVGAPIAGHFQNDDALAETASKFAHMYGQTVHCDNATIANHSAYQCSLAGGSLLGTHVSGNAVFILSAETIYPVLCTAPSDSVSRDVLNDSHPSGRSKQAYEKNVGREDDDARAVYQKCDTVFSSIRVKPQTAQSQTAQTTPAKGAAPPSAPAVPAKIEQAKMDQPSSASTSQVPAQAQDSQISQAAGAVAPGSTVPAGFKVHAFTYCKSHNDCFNASVLVPADAKLVSSTCKQSVFESKVQGTSFLLMAGPAAGQCEGSDGPDPVRWNQLADPENKRAPGTYSTISSLNTTVDGKPAVITTMSFRKGLESWMGKRAELESNGVPLVVGCMAPRDHFADGDTICSTLIGSLQLP